jgi:hypothetical protein
MNFRVPVGAFYSGARLFCGVHCKIRGLILSYRKKINVLASVFLLSATVDMPLPQRDRLCYPDVIGEAGNANGSFTGETRNNIAGLRGKQRYPAANVFNYDAQIQLRHAVLTTKSGKTARSLILSRSVNVDRHLWCRSKRLHLICLSSTSTLVWAISFLGFDPFSLPGYFDHVWVTIRPQMGRRRID